MYRHGTELYDPQARRPFDVIVFIFCFSFSTIYWLIAKTKYFTCCNCLSFFLFHWIGKVNERDFDDNIFKYFDTRVESEKQSSR